MRLAPLTLVVLAAGCALGPRAAPTPTPASLSEIDFRSFLSALEGLPDHLAIGRTTAAETPGDVLGVPEADGYLLHGLEWDGTEAGEAMLWAFGSSEAALEGYRALVGHFEEVHGEGENIAMDVRIQPIDGLGDAAAAEVAGIGLAGGSSHAVRVELAFVRCHLLADVRLDDPADLDTAVVYARLLDESLGDLACR